MIRIWTYAAVFTALNLAFVPLMALYGLRVCPVLHVAGFWGGCSYSGAFIALVLGLNFLLLALLSRARQGAVAALLRAHPLPAFAAVYLAATLAALAGQAVFFRVNHMSGLSRAPEVLALASALLGVTQAYGLNWVFAGALRRPLAGLRARWAAHVARVTLPLGAALGVLAHFLLRQSGALNRGKVAPTRGVDGLIADSVLLILFLLAWLGVTYLFHFLEERTHADSVQAQIEELNGMNFSYRSAPGAAWGLWSEIMGQLNQAAGALAERYSLFSSFTKFVGRDAADKAVKGEMLGTAGTELELTILMSDIRGFTALSEQLGSAAVTTVLNSYFEAMVGELTAHGLAADKFVGDGLLAYVLPEKKSAAECNAAAVASALGMFLRLEGLNASFAASGTPELRIGIGLCRGRVTLGTIGGGDKLQYTVIGDAVNRAARYEGLCRETGARLVVARDLLETLPEEYAKLFRPYGKREIKGLSGQVEIYGY